MIRASWTAIALTGLGCGGLAANQGGGLGSDAGDAAEAGAPACTGLTGAVTLAKSITPSLNVHDENPCIVADAENVYWTQQGVLLRIGRCGGTVSTLASGLGPGFPGGPGDTGLVLGEDRIFAVAPDALDALGHFSGLTSIVSIPLSGGAPTTLATHQDGGWALIGADAEHVYWGVGPLLDGDFAILRAPIEGGSVATVVAAAWTSAFADPTGVYWGTSEGIYKSASSGAGGVRLASIDGAPSQLSVDSTGIYWLYAEKTRTTLLRLPLAGGTPETVVSQSWAAIHRSSTEDLPALLVHDGAHIYASSLTRSTGLGANTSSIVRVGATGKPTVLSSGPYTVSAILASGDMLFAWGTGAVTAPNGTVAGSSLLLLGVPLD